MFSCFVRYCSLRTFVSLDAYSPLKQSCPGWSGVRSLEPLPHYQLQPPPRGACRIQRRYP